MNASLACEWEAFGDAILTFLCYKRSYAEKENAGASKKNIRQTRHKLDFHPLHFPV